MKIHLFAIGKMKSGPAMTLCQDYLKRMKTPVIIREFEVKKNLSGDELKRAESKLFLDEMPTDRTVIALDERGKNLSSHEIVNKIESFQMVGTKNLVFLIGGANGHDESIRAQANLLLSFGKATWPHMMVRTMVLEQIYRAYSILDGHPYHRE